MPISPDIYSGLMKWLERANAAAYKQQCGKLTGKAREKVRYSVPDSIRAVIDAIGRDDAETALHIRHTCEYANV
jgi:hypothetical protein